MDNNPPQIPQIDPVTGQPVAQPTPPPVSPNPVPPNTGPVSPAYSAPPAAELPASPPHNPPQPTQTPYVPPPQTFVAPPYPAAPAAPTPPYQPAQTPMPPPAQPAQPMAPVVMQPATIPTAVPAVPASASQPLLTPILGKPLFKWLIAALFLGIAIGNIWHSIHIFRLMSNLNDIGSEFLDSNTELSKFYHTISIVSLLFGLLRLAVAACVLFASKIGRILLYVTAGAQAVYTILYAAMFMGKMVIADHDIALRGLLWGIVFLVINIGIILYISLSKPAKQNM